MEILFAFVNTGFVAASAVIILLFIRYFYDTRFTYLRTLFFITSFCIVNGGLSSLSKGMNDTINTVRPLLLLLISIVLIKYILSISYSKSVISFCINGIGLTLGSAIAPLIFSLFKITIIPDTLHHDLVLYSLVNIVISIICILFTAIFIAIKIIYKNFQPSKPMIISIILTFTIIATNSGINYFTLKNRLLVSVIVCLLSIAYCSVMLKITQEFASAKADRLELEQQKFYNRSLDSALHNLRRFKHDFNNNLNVIHAMIKMQKYEDALKYIIELGESINNDSNSFLFNIKNAGLYGIISAKIKAAKDAQVNMSVQVIGEVEEITCIKITELCEIVGIFLDNAIEAAAVSTDKTVALNIKAGNEFIEISVKNACDKAPDMDKIFLPGYSTKGTGRGNGLHIVKSLLENNAYVLSNTCFDEKEMCFIQDMMLKKGA